MKRNNITLFLLSILAFIFFVSTLVYFGFTNTFQPDKKLYYQTGDSPQQNLTVITEKHSFSSNSYKNTQVLFAKKGIEQTFIAPTDNLGIIAIPFNTYNKSINDTVIFKIKETGSKDWYFQSNYKTNQFQTDIPFPFGFPIISDSKNKSYTFQVISIEGKEANAIAISTTNPFFITKHKYSKSELQNDSSKVFDFIISKVKEQVRLLTLIQFFVLFLSLLAPFIIYYIYIAVKAKPKRIHLLLNGLLALMILHLFSEAIAEITYFYPREYRDAALIDIANQFATGVNPFTLTNALPHTYIYGFISPLTAAVVSILFHIDIALAQHLISFICTVLLCFIVAKEIFKTTKNTSFILMSLVVVLIYNTVTFRPEPLAILLTIYSLYLVNNNKILNLKKTLLLSLIVIILFYIKQYFIILFPVLLLYFIYNRSKKTLLYFIVASLLIGLGSVLVVDKVFPIYFSNTFFNYLPVAGSYWTDWMLLQSLAFFQLNWLFIVLFAVFAFKGLVKNMDIHLNLTEFNKPLIRLPDTPLGNIYFVYTFIAIVSLTFKLGNNGGAFLSYYTQLLPIPLTVFCVSYLYIKYKKHRLYKIISLYFVILFILQNYLYLGIPSVNFTEERLAWNRTIDVISKHNPQKGYISPTYTIEAINKGWPVSDNGHTEYYGLNALGFKMPPGQATHLEKNLELWQNNLDYKIKNKEFSFIIRPAGKHINVDYLNQYYVLKERLEVPNLGTSEFWVPK